MVELVIDEGGAPLAERCRSCGQVVSRELPHFCFGSGESGYHQPAGPSLFLDGPIPRGVCLSERADGWHLAITLKSLSAAIEAWIFLPMWIAALIAIRQAKHSVGVDLVWWWLALFTPLAFAKAMLLTCGCCDISVCGDRCDVVTRIGPLKWRRAIRWSALRCVRLLYRKGRRGSVRKAIVLDADRVIQFGEEMSDEQRAYVAALLVQKHG